MSDESYREALERTHAEALAGLRQELEKMDAEQRSLISKHLTLAMGQLSAAVACVQIAEDTLARIGGIENLNPLGGRAEDLAAYCDAMKATIDIVDGRS